MTHLKSSVSKKSHFGMILLVYLLGIFMGALDTGIVTPARTVIQNSLDIDGQSGIWMLTIYTLAYASSIPISGKLADKWGRKYIYLVSIFLFGLGSLLCGLSSTFTSFPLLLVARVIQAIGGGGIIPVATAEFGTTFPPEKRGLALGLVGGVFGIANIFGSSAGSAILDLFGTDRWQFIFYINLPICLIILLVGFIYLPNTKISQVKKIDKWGVLLIVLTTVSLLYGLRNIDFFNFKASIQSTDVYPFLLFFLILLPFLIFAEKKAEDPVLNLSYFTHKPILITLLLSFFVGVIMMGMVFVPQFCENLLKIPTGKGGYFVIILGLFAGISSPLSGKLLDTIGAKITLALGFVLSISGACFLIFVASIFPSFLTAATSLALIGLGMGFTIGAPLNYMMLSHVDSENSTSALSTLSLIRSIGTTIAPAIMIGFISHAAGSLQTDLMPLLPNHVTIPPLPYATELTETLNDLKTNPKTKDTFSQLDFPDLTSFSDIQINFSNNSSTLPEDLLALMQSADVTNITERCQTVASRMFDEMTPGQITSIQSGIDTGITALTKSTSDLETQLASMNDALTGINTALKHLPPTSPQFGALNGKKQGITTALSQMETAKQHMNTTLMQMNTLKAAIPNAFSEAKSNYLVAIATESNQLESFFQDTLNKGFIQIYTTVAITSLLAALLLMAYPTPQKVTTKEMESIS